jgi:hypothetical protein
MRISRPIVCKSWARPAWRVPHITVEHGGIHRSTYNVGEEELGGVPRLIRVEILALKSHTNVASSRESWTSAVVLLLLLYGRFAVSRHLHAAEQLVTSGRTRPHDLIIKSFGALKDLTNSLPPSPWST